MEDYKDYIILVRLVRDNEARAIKNGDAEHIGSKPVATISNNFDGLKEDEKVAFCYTTELRAKSLEDAQAQIQEDHSILTDDTIGECLSYMLNEKHKKYSDNFSLMYFVLSPEAYEKMFAMNQAYEGEGYYENEYGEKIATSEVVVKSDAMSTMYNPKCAGEFYAEDLVADGYLKDLGHNYENTNEDEEANYFGSSNDGYGDEEYY